MKRGRECIKKICFIPVVKFINFPIMPSYFNFLIVFVLVEYEDGCGELVRPEDLTLKRMKPSYTVEDRNGYEGKDIIEPGMLIRLRWSKEYDRCLVTVRAVDENYAAVNEHFEKLAEKNRGPPKVCSNLA